MAESPLQTLAFAVLHTSARTIHLAPGTYASPEELRVRRVLKVEGPEDGAVVVKSPVVAKGGELELSRMELTQGIAAVGRARVKLDRVTLSSTTSPSALTAEASRVDLIDARVACGEETCIDAKSSTVALIRTELEAPLSSKRALRAETSSVSAEAVRVTGSSINQILAGRKTRLFLRESRLEGAGGSALAAIGGAEIVADRVTISKATRFGILVESSKASIARTLVEPTKGFSLGFAGADVEVASSTFDASSDGVASIGAHAGRPSTVRMVDTLVRHAKRPGLLIAEGDVTLDRMRFVGESGGRGEGGDAILANGTDAILTVKGAEIESPAGFGISLTNGAQGTITATIARPREGGIYIESVLGVPVLIKGTRVERCGSGTGIVVHDATEVRIDSTTITECPEAGLMVGQGSNVVLTKSKLTKNGRYGIAAFGASTVEVSGTRASGGKWVTFATCADGARIEDAGDNKLVGQVSVCP